MSATTERRVVKEYSRADYQRKWEGTIGFYRFRKDDRIRYGAISEVSGVDDAIVMHIDGSWYPVEGEYEHRPQVEMLYYHVGSGIYPVMGADFIVLSRRQQKAFSVGFSLSNYRISVFRNGGYASGWTARNIDFLGKIPPKAYDPSVSAGWLTNNLWYLKDQLMYLHTTVGFIKEGVAFIGNSLLYKQLKPQLEGLCKIECL